MGLVILIAHDFVNEDGEGESFQTVSMFTETNHLIHQSS
jgi:hypothetical protein